MTRPSFETIYLDLATSLARRSTCSRLHVGCVITSEDHRQIFGIGYNGGATGLDNDCESDAPGACGHVHAEMNAIINCMASRADKKRVYLTHLPCKQCAKLLVNLGGVVSVSYVGDYRIRDGRELLRSAGIACEQVPMGPT